MNGLFGIAHGMAFDAFLGGRDLLVVHAPAFDFAAIDCCLKCNLRTKHATGSANGYIFDIHFLPPVFIQKIHAVLTAVPFL